MAFVRCDSTNMTFDADGTAVNTTFDTSDFTIALMYVWWHDGQGHQDLDAIPTMGGVNMTSLGAQIEQGNCRIQGYVLPAPAQGASTAIVVTPDAGAVGTATFAGITVIGFDDAIDSVTPVDGYVTAGGTDTTAESTVTSETDDIPVFFVLARAAFAPSGIAATNYMEREDHINGIGMVGCGEGTGASSVAFVGTLSAGAVNEWATMGININVDAGGGGGGLGIPIAMHHYKTMRAA